MRRLTVREHAAHPIVGSLGLSPLSLSQVALLPGGDNPKPGEEKLIRNIRGRDCSQLAWNPRRRILAIGWSCGAVSLWDGEMEQIRPTALSERTNKHSDKFPITVLQWADDGQHFATGDKQVG